MTSHQVTIPRVLIPVLCPFLCPLKRNQTPDTNYCPTVACCCMLFELLHARRTTFPRPNQRERGGELHFLPNMVNHDQNISKHCFFPSFVFYSELTQQLATSLSFAAFSFQAFYNAMHSFKKRHTHTHLLLQPDIRLLRDAGSAPPRRPASFSRTWKAPRSARASAE